MCGRMSKVFCVRWLANLISLKFSTLIELISRAFIDCVGLIVKTKSGKRYLNVDNHVWFYTVSGRYFLEEDHIPSHYQCFG